MIHRYLVPLLLMLLSAALYVGYIDETYRDIARQLDKAVVLRSFIADAEDAQKKLDNIAAQYKAFPPDGNERLEVLLPPKIDSVRFIIDVNEVALRHGMNIDSPMVTLSNDDEASPRKYKLYNVLFKTTATYRVFREFLADLERSLALRDINNIAIKPGSITASSGYAPSPDLEVFEYTVSINSYALH